MMTNKTKLLHVCLLNFVIALVLFMLHPDASEFKVIVFILRGWMLTDSSHFMEHAWDVIHTHLPLYQTLFFEQHFKFIYPTSALLLDSAAHYLHLSIARFIQGLVVLSVPVTFFFAGECFLLILPQDSDRRSSPLQIRLLIASLGFFFYPLVTSVLLGQIQTVLTMLFTLSVWCWILDRRAAAGVCVALICIVKPQLALYLLWAIFRRE